jgi:hypothetical protein
MFLQMEGVLYKSHLFKTDWDDMAHFLKTEDRHLSLCGIDLKKKVRHNLEFVKECLELDKKIQQRTKASLCLSKKIWLSPRMSSLKNPFNLQKQSRICWFTNLWVATCVSC